MNPTFWTGFRQQRQAGLLGIGRLFFPYVNSCTPFSVAQSRTGNSPEYFGSGPASLLSDRQLGTMMSIVQRQLDRLGVPQRHEAITLERLGELSGAAVMNSWTPGIPVTAIAENVIAQAKPFISLLHEAYQAEPASSL
ncbi:aminotransferase class IV [Kineobactrum salinum]|uniref:hypothetical protein n=1 Tax=Kineobactrum salinum TaxID=2708301 RepID=UPI0018D94B9D|nr:hypothetical protein [Kineobactrum salinum]